ncbi:glycosyltransferase family 2 protein [Reichenbachiella carrageenanivorans]|uniref:Glycosyltransferase family 2 protein n=1 Tax=Reichenbachiella carrageenanivorans TaxID=2979869 RepID=A0ABY6CYF0_9BACT|nr:glycosyltransferase family 2 protein [Reichenbachiella carrageenanivorans]UXX78944.1 glycosyltransferase family 2 protein [Reichenbachiella carrageenanivorans]
MAKTAVVILNYNGAQYLEQFLPSVVQYSDTAEIIIADNASTDQSLAFLKDNYPDLRLIVFEENLGYTGGYNEALQQLDHDYCILLNSDIEVTPNWIEPITNFMDEHPEVAACQPKILDYQDKTKFEYAGAAGGFIDFMGYPYCRGRLFDTLESDLGQYDDITEITWATGACMFVRTSDFKAAGGFDVDFFAHMEEIDLCWRFRLMGKALYCIPASKIYHVGGGTLNKLNPRKTYLNFRNNLSLLFKNESGTALLWKLPFKFVLDWAAALKFGLDQSWDHAWAVLRAQFDFMRRLLSNWKKRRKIHFQTTKKVSNTKVLLPFQYFIKDKRTFDQL